MRRALGFLAAGLIAGCAHFQPSPRYEIVGYFAAWKPDTKVDPSLLTVVNYAFLDICWDGQHGNVAVERLAPCREANGSLTLDDPARDAAQFARLVSLKKDNPSLKLVGSVGGWTRSNRFSDMAADSATRTNFIASTVGFVRKHGFDGIDIDWEYPGEIGVPCAAGFTCDRAEDKRNFVTLARELRAALDAAGAEDHKHYIATIAAGCDRKFVMDGTSDAWTGELAASLDWVNLMTYDYHGTWETRAGMVAPLYNDPLDPAGTNVDATVTMYLKAGVPPRKLTLGIPFYGKGWAGCAPGPNGDGLYQQCRGPVTGVPEATYEYSTLVGASLFARQGYARHWSAAGVPYLYDALTGTFISYDDPASVQGKARYLVQRGLRGAMYWEIAQDHGQELAREISGGLAR